VAAGVVVVGVTATAVALASDGDVPSMPDPYSGNLGYREVRP
jgi:hypothetical protein